MAEFRRFFPDGVAAGRTPTDEELRLDVRAALAVGEPPAAPPRPGGTGPRAAAEATCGHWMPRARRRCGLTPRHRGAHR